MRLTDEARLEPDDASLGAGDPCRGGFLLSRRPVLAAEVGTGVH